MTILLGYGCRNFFLNSSDLLNDDTTETSELSVGDSAVIYAVTRSFIIGDRLVYLSLR